MITICHDLFAFLPQVHSHSYQAFPFTLFGLFTTQDVWAGSAAVLVNSEFVVSPLANPASELIPFLQSLSTAYSFQPVAEKGLLGDQQVTLLHGVNVFHSNSTPPSAAFRCSMTCDRLCCMYPSSGCKHHDDPAAVVDFS